MYNSKKVSDSDVELVWEDYKFIFEEYYEPRKFTAKRKGRIKQRLKEFSRSELKKSMLAIADNDYMVGNNKDNRFYAKPEYCFRSYEKVEEWLNKFEENKEVKEEVKYKQNESFNEIQKNYKDVIYNLKSLDYQDYLKTNHWKHFVEECKKFFNNKCQICGNKEKLQVHHNNYKNRGRETFNDVVLLCKDCHSKFHNGGDHQ